LAKRAGGRGFHAIRQSYLAISEKQNETRHLLLSSGGGKATVSRSWDREEQDLGKDQESG